METDFDRRRRASWRSVRRSAALVVAALVAIPCHAHTVINERELPPGSQNITLRVTHACPGSATTSVRMRIPEGVTRVFPFYMAGWAIKTTPRKLAVPFKTEHGTQVTETVDEVTWTGGPVPDGLFAEFRVKVELPDTPGKTLYFKVIQVCEKGELRWIETPAQGEKDFDYVPGNPVAKYREPAAFVRIVPTR